MYVRVRTLIHQRALASKVNSRVYSNKKNMKKTINNYILNETTLYDYI